MSSHINPQSLFTRQNVRRLHVMKQRKSSTVKSDENTPLSSPNPYYLRQKLARQYPPANEALTPISQEKVIKEEDRSSSDQTLLLSETRSQVSSINNVDMKEDSSDDVYPIRSSSSPLDDYSSLSPLDDYSSSSPLDDYSSLPPLDNIRDPDSDDNRDHDLDSEYTPSMSDDSENLYESSSDSSSLARLSSAESLNQHFEEDKRKPDPGRRNLYPAGRRLITLKHESSPPNCAGSNTELDWANLPTCREDEVEEPSQLTFPEIKLRAKMAAATIRSASSGVQTRTPWSHNDEQLLLHGIEKYGCSWSFLLTLLHGWDRKRDQIALKDKARNMKVSFLRAGVPLPSNFERVRLGKKEIASVRTVIPDYEPEK